MQLDIFEDSRDVMLRNDVVQALERKDLAAAQTRLQALQQEYPDDLHLTALATLIDAVPALTAPAVPDHAALCSLRLQLEQLEPIALREMGPQASKLWLHAFWTELAHRSARLPFVAACEADHAAPLYLHVQAWETAQDAVAGIESWRRIPAPLAWMARARLQLLGLQASWPLLAELAWLAPTRLEALIASAPDPTLQQLKDSFDRNFEPPPAHVVPGQTEPQDAAADLAWFPAWVLTAQPRWASALSLAQAGQHTAPEQAMRLLLQLLGLERQGRHHDIIALRKELRDLHSGLYAAYLKTR